MGKQIPGASGRQVDIRFGTGAGEYIHHHKLAHLPEWVRPAAAINGVREQRVRANNAQYQQYTLHWGTAQSEQHLDELRTIWLTEVETPRTHIIDLMCGRRRSDPLSTVWHGLRMRGRPLVGEARDAWVQTCFENGSAVKVSFVTRDNHHQPLEVEMSTGSSFSSSGIDSRRRAVTHVTGIDNQAVTWLTSNATDGSAQWLVVGGSLKHLPAPPLHNYVGGPGVLLLYRWEPATGQIALQRRYFHNFGACWKLKANPGHTESPDSLGLVGAIFNDGRLRILEICSPEAVSSVEEIELEISLLEFQMPELHFTCFDWSTESTLVAGTNAGLVVQYNLAMSLEVPTWSRLVHRASVIDVAACRPSYPYLSLTTSWDGDVRVVDMRKPLHEGHVLQRNRIMCAHLGYSDFTRSAVIVAEGNSIQISALRNQGNPGVRFGDALITSVAAAGPLHPFIASGDAAGELHVNNVLYKILNRKLFAAQKKVYRYDVERPEAQIDTANRPNVDAQSGYDLSRSLPGWRHRFIEDFETLTILPGGGAIPTARLHDPEVLAEAKCDGKRGPANKNLDSATRDNGDGAAGNDGRGGNRNLYPDAIAIRGCAWNTNYGREDLLASCTLDFLRVDQLNLTR